MARVAIVIVCNGRLAGRTALMAGVLRNAGYQIQVVDRLPERKVSILGVDECEGLLAKAASRIIPAPADITPDLRRHRDYPTLKQGLRDPRIRKRR